ncbi:hypothetical protein ACLOJK_041236 [Asimina triloba]
MIEATRCDLGAAIRAARQRTRSVGCEMQVDAESGQIAMGVADQNLHKGSDDDRLLDANRCFRWSRDRMADLNEPLVGCAFHLDGAGPFG